MEKMDRQFPTSLTNGSSECDRQIARELDGLLRDRELWTVIGSLRAETNERAALAQRALSLYSVTSPTLAQRVQEFGSPLDYAVGILRDIADACAILSHAWPEADRDNLNVAKRSDIETAIRSFGVADWASSLEIEFALEAQGLSHPPEDVAPEDGPAGLSPEGLAASWSRTIRTFHAAVRVRSANLESPGIQSDEGREAASAVVALARIWVLWARRFADSDLVAVAATQLFAAQGYFIAAWQQEPIGDLFPNDDYLREFLTVTRAMDWLIDHHAEIPVSLTR